MEMIPASPASQTVPQEVMDTVSSAIGGLSTEAGEYLQVLARQITGQYLAVREANGRLILRIPLAVSLVGGIILLKLVPVRRTILLVIAALFARVYFAIEDTDEPTVAIANEKQRQD